MKPPILLAILGFLSQLVYSLFFFLNPLKKIAGSYVYSPQNIDFFASVGILLLAFAIYLLAFRVISQDKNDNTGVIIFWAIIFSLAMFFIIPIVSGDVFAYINLGRVRAIHGLNPYLVPYESLNGDIFHNVYQSYWLSQITPYGPSFLFLSGLLTRLAGDGLLINIFLFKGFFTLIHVLNILLVKSLTRSKKAIFLFSWNPLIIFENLVNAHNDGLMLFLLLLSIFLIKKRPSLLGSLSAWSIFILSFLTKIFTLVLAPIFYFYLLSRVRTSKRKIVLTFYLSGLTILILVISYSTFWQNGELFGRYINLIINRIELNTIFISPLVLVSTSVFFSLGLKNYFYFGKLIGKLGFLIIFFYLLIKSSFLNKASYKQFLRLIMIVLGIFLLSSLDWFFPWYLTSFIAVLSVYMGTKGNFSKKIYIYLPTLYGILNYLILR